MCMKIIKYLLKDITKIEKIKSIKPFNSNSLISQTNFTYTGDTFVKQASYKSNNVKFINIECHRFTKRNSYLQRKINNTIVVYITYVCRKTTSTETNTGFIYLLNPQATFCIRNMFTYSNPLFFSFRMCSPLLTVL